MTKYLYLVIFVVGVVLGIGAQQTRIANLKAEHADTLKDIAEKTTEAYSASLVYIKQVNATITELKEQNYETKLQLEQSYIDAESARVKWLREFTALQSYYRNSTPAIGSSSTSIQDQETFDMFIRLLDRDSRIMVELANYADQLEAAGLMCEKSHDVQTNQTNVR